MTAMPHQTQDPTCYALVVTNDGQLLNNTVHATRAERRDACVEVLKDACPDVTKAEVNDILLTFGGADPDSAIGSISELYAEFGVDIYLEDQAVPEEPVAGVPVAMHSVVQSYENSAMNTILHFPTKDARADHLRRQLNNLNTAVPPEETFSDTELATRVEKALRGLIDQKVSVHLVTSFAPVWTQ
jgi:hypothetical protein